MPEADESEPRNKIMTEICCHGIICEYFLDFRDTESCFMGPALPHNALQILDIVCRSLYDLLPKKACEEKPTSVTKKE